jgi:hypothetical protein
LLSLLELDDPRAFLSALLSLLLADDDDELREWDLLRDFDGLDFFDLTFFDGSGELDLDLLRDNLDLDLDTLLLLDLAFLFDLESDDFDLDRDERCVVGDIRPTSLDSGRELLLLKSFWSEVP